jgi:hypothetical protein
MEEEHSSEMLVNCYQIIQGRIPEDSCVKYFLNLGQSEFVCWNLFQGLVLKSMFIKICHVYLSYKLSVVDKTVSSMDISLEA